MSKKQVIRINESKLKQIVIESVKRCLKESRMPVNENEMSFKDFVKSKNEEIRNVLKEAKAVSKDNDIVEKILYIFSGKNPNYWSYSPVLRFTDVEEICFKLIYQKKYDNSEVARILRIAAKRVGEVLPQNKGMDSYTSKLMYDSDVKYYGLNLRRLAKIIQNSEGYWRPKYYRF